MWDKHKSGNPLYKGNKRVFKYLRGYVIFSTLGGFEENFMNDLIGQGVVLWDIQKSEAGMAACCYPNDYFKIAKAAKSYQVRLRITKKKGLLFRATRYRNRYGIAIGLLAFALFVTIMSNYIWRIEVQGNEMVPSSEIYHIAEELGIKRGAFIPALDLSSIERKALLRLGDLSWIGLNRNGSQITIAVKERVKAPDVVSETSPCNIVAAKSGQIIYAEVRSGQMLKALKDTVKAGEIIVSGLVDDGTGQILYKHSDAVIIAQYPVNKEFSMSYTQTIQRPTGKVINRSYLKVAGISLPLFFALPLQGDYEYSESNESISILGFDTPFGLKKGRYMEFTDEEVIYTQDEAKQKLLAEIKVYEETLLKDGKTISKEIIETPAEAGYTINVQYVMEGDIAQPQEISIDNKIG